MDQGRHKRGFRQLPRIVLIRRGLRLGQSFASDVRTAERPRGKSTPTECIRRATNHALLVTRVFKEPQPRPEMLLGTGKIAAPVAHHQAQPISGRNLGWLIIAEGKLKRLVGKRAGGRQVACSPGTETP